MDDIAFTASMISGLLAILVITLIKLIELESWPPFLNEYAANTGVWGMAADQKADGRSIPFREGDLIYGVVVSLL